MRSLARGGGWGGQDVNFANQAATEVQSFSTLLDKHILHVQGR